MNLDARTTSLLCEAIANQAHCDSSPESHHLYSLADAKSSADSCPPFLNRFVIVPSRVLYKPSAPQAPAYTHHPNSSPSSGEKRVVSVSNTIPSLHSPGYGFAQRRADARDGLDKEGQNET